MTAYAATSASAAATNRSNDDDDENSSNGNNPFPFVIFPEFAAMAHQAIKQTGANYIGYTPLVKHTERDAYEQYMATHQAKWLKKSIQKMMENEDGVDEEDVSDEIELFNIADLVQPFIIQRDEETNEIKPFPTQEEYAPVAQIEPLKYNIRLLNDNALDFVFFKRVWDDMVKYNHAVLSEVDNMDDYLEESSEEEEGDYDEMLLPPPDEKYKWPASFMAAPVYDRLDATDDDSSNGGDVPPRKIVGAITAEMPWHSYFQNLIPEGVDGIMGTFCFEEKIHRDLILVLQIYFHTQVF